MLQHIFTLFFSNFGQQRAQDRLPKRKHGNDHQRGGERWQSGTPLHVLRELGGWNSYRMVLRYAHLSADHLASYTEAMCRPPRTLSGTASVETAKENRKSLIEMEPAEGFEPRPPDYKT